MPKSNPQNIKAGDIVTIKFIGENSFDARVTLVTKRYNSDAINYIRLDGLDTSLPDLVDEDGTSFCDIGFATLKQVAPYVVATQRVRVKHNNYETDSTGYGVPGNPHIYRTDWFPGLTRHIVMGMDVDVPYGFKEDLEVAKLWVKNGMPGRVRKENMVFNLDHGRPSIPYVIYNRKHLRRWVRNNISRLIRSQSEAMKSERDMDRRMEQDAMTDMDADYRLFRQTFQDEQQDAELYKDLRDFDGPPLTLGDILAAAIERRREAAEHEAACKLLDISPDTTRISEEGFEL